MLAQVVLFQVSILVLFAQLLENPLMEEKVHEKFSEEMGRSIHLRNARMVIPMPLMDVMLLEI